jgi:phosphinothricin acetyltransferase
MKVSFRNAMEADLDRIAEIYNYYILNSNAVYDETEKDFETMENWYKSKQQLNMPVVVAELNGEFAGYGSFSQFRPWEGFRFCVEHSLYVHPNLHGKGVGQGLLKALIGEAKLRNMRTMVAGIDAENHKSVKLHERLGFEMVGVFKNAGYKKGKWLNLAMMQLQL